MDRTWFRLAALVLTWLVIVSTEEASSDSSLVRLLSSKQPNTPHSKSHNNQVNTDDVPIKLPQKAALNNQETADDNAQKREEERFESKILGNPRPPDSKDKINEKTPSKELVEMEPGDTTPLESHRNQQNENLKQELEKANKNKPNKQWTLSDELKSDTSLESYKKQDNFTIESQPVRKFSSNHGLDFYENFHRVEPEYTEELALTNEEQDVQNKLDYLKAKLKLKHRLNLLKERKKELEQETKLEDTIYYRQPETEMFKSSKSDFLLPNKKRPQAIMGAHPKYKMRRIDSDRSSTDEILSSHLIKEQIRLKNNTIARPEQPTKAYFSFSYDKESPFGPPVWQMLNADWTCNSRKQSPINIDTDGLMDNVIVKNIAVKIQPANRQLTGTLRNNGHAPTFSLSNEVSVKLFGGTLYNEYYLKQLHFHFGCDTKSGSEHRINNEEFPLELHLVFWDNSTFETFPEAAKADRGIVVLAVLFEIEIISEPLIKQTPLSQIVQLLRHIEEEGDNITVLEEFEFRLEKLIPNIMNSEKADRFFIYEGSLTTPGCYESVTWIVMATHPPVTDEQLNIFRMLQSTKVNRDRNEMCNNYRPIQKKNGRRIYTNII